IAVARLKGYSDAVLRVFLPLQPNRQVVVSPSIARRIINLRQSPLPGTLLGGKIGQVARTIGMAPIRDIVAFAVVVYEGLVGDWAGGRMVVQGNTSPVMSQLAEQITKFRMSYCVGDDNALDLDWPCG